MVFMAHPVVTHFKQSIRVSLIKRTKEVLKRILIFKW